MRKDCIRTGLSSLTIALSVLASMTALATAEDVKTGDSGRQTLGPDLITFADSDAILASLKRNGIEAELVKDSDGDPKVTSSETDNPFSIHFYSCTDHDQCKFVQFTSGWNLKNGITLDKLEAWNEHKVWGQAYRDSDKDPWLAMPVNFVGGVTPDHLDDMVDWWLTIEDDFQKHIGWDKEK